jgi:hypothetical protein
MLKEERGAVTIGDSGKRGGWRVIKTVRPRLRVSCNKFASLKQRGHLRLLRRAEDARGSEATETQASLPQEESTSAGTKRGPMPKRQQEATKAYTDDTRPGEAPGSDASIDPPTIKREFLLTQLADDTLKDAVDLVSSATGTNLTNSHFFRVLIKCIAHAMPQLEIEVSKLGKLKRPSNAREGQAAREEYERTIAAAVVAALRSSPPFDPNMEDGGKGKGSGKRSE